MKLSLDDRIGPLLAIGLGNLVIPVLAAFTLGKVGFGLAFPWAGAAEMIGLQVFRDGAFLGVALAQGILYSAILAIGCFRERLGRTAGWLLLVHFTLATILFIWAAVARRSLS